MEFLFSLLVFPFFDVVNTSVREELLLNYSWKYFFLYKSSFLEYCLKCFVWVQHYNSCGSVVDLSTTTPETRFKPGAWQKNRVRDDSTQTWPRNTHLQGSVGSDCPTWVIFPVPWSRSQPSGGANDQTLSTPVWCDGFHPPALWTAPGCFISLCFTPEWQQAYFSCRASITTSQALCWGS